jgi:thiol-disulfide isomerase/thioredoxin
MQLQPTQPTRNSTRKWLAVGLAVVIAWVIFVSSARQMLKLDGLAPPSLESSAVPRPVDFGWTLLDLDGKPVDFARFKGRTILLNLWATWCPPCLKEMPSIANLAASEDLKGRNIVFLCVSTDESAEALRQFMKDKDWKMTVLRATSLPPSFETEGIPATFLIGPDGGIAAAEIGAAQWDDPSVIAFLQKLAAKK